jgi:hypothetical protein
MKLVVNPPFSILVQGDDIMLLLAALEFHDSEFKAFMIEYSRLKGFKIKFAITTRKLSKIEYCSRAFWPVSHSEHRLGYLLGPLPGKVLTKLPYASLPVDNQYMRNRMIALGMENAVNHVPFLREYITHLKRICTDAANSKKFKHKYKHYAKKKHNYCMRTWSFLYDRYGLTKMDVDYFNEQLKTVNHLPYSLPILFVERLFEIDC